MKLIKKLCVFRIDDYTTLEALFDVRKRSFDDLLGEVHKDIAATLQEATTAIILKLVNALYEKTKSKNLCMSGGVALNCVANRIAFEHSKFDNVYIQPAANDAGTSLGAAMKLNLELSIDFTKGITLKDTYLGPFYSNVEIGRSIQSQHLKYYHSDNIEEKVATLLAEGKIAGWFQGAMEFGPRALGNRSLLADPRDYKMVKKLNSIIKHRKDHRPFCPSVLSEEAEYWFDIKKKTTATDYMLMAYPVLENKAERIPAVLHVDNTSRIQTVRKGTNPRYHKLISEFYKKNRSPTIIKYIF